MREYGGHNIFCVSKTSETESDAILINKLKKGGLDSIIIRLISQWLKNGYLQKRSVSDVASGVPQASILNCVLAFVLMT